MAAIVTVVVAVLLLPTPSLTTNVIVRGAVVSGPPSRFWYVTRRSRVMKSASGCGVVAVMVNTATPGVVVSSKVLVKLASKPPVTRSTSSFSCRASSTLVIVTVIDVRFALSTSVMVASPRPG